ncbi:beta-ketoacyl synthase, N-terminal domain protein, partial [Vibrio parahaemolyticus V-223/04]
LLFSELAIAQTRTTFPHHTQKG